MKKMTIKELRKKIRELKAMLKNSDLAPAERADIENQIEKLKEAIDKTLSNIQ